MPSPEATGAEYSLAHDAGPTTHHVARSDESTTPWMTTWNDEATRSRAIARTWLSVRGEPSRAFPMALHGERASSTTAGRHRKGLLARRTRGTFA